MKVARPDHHKLQQDEHWRHDFRVVEGDVAVQLLAKEVTKEEQYEEHEEALECMLLFCIITSLDTVRTLCLILNGGCTPGSSPAVAV